MSQAANILLLAAPAAGDILAGRLAGDDLLRVDDGYDALLELGRRRWPVVVLASQQHGFPGLCRASRRLQGDSQLFALCAPAAEPETRAMLGKVLDDYFIYPPTHGDLAAIQQAVRSPRTAQAGGATAAGTPLISRDLAGLMEAANSIGALESHLAETACRRVGAPAAWFDADKLPADVSPLLLAAGERPRVLACEGKVDLQAAPLRAFVAAVNDCLPALMDNARRMESLHRLAITDHLTGAYNRRYFYHMTDRILVRAGRSGSRVTMLLYDIDDFKRYNDAYGYAAGDEILRETAKLIKRITRSNDVVARIGGDEFAVLFWDAAGPRQADSKPLETAHGLADRFRREVTQHPFPMLGPEARGALSISGGLASFPANGRNCKELLRQCDHALKDAKSSGKNAIRLVGQSDGSASPE